MSSSINISSAFMVDGYVSSVSAAFDSNLHGRGNWRMDRWMEYENSMLGLAYTGEL